jgi:hypothetical protein
MSSMSSAAVDAVKKKQAGDSKKQPAPKGNTDKFTWNNESEVTITPAPKDKDKTKKEGD